MHYLHFFAFAFVSSFFAFSFFATNEDSFFVLVFSETELAAAVFGFVVCGGTGLDVPLRFIFSGIGLGVARLAFSGIGLGVERFFTVSNDFFNSGFFGSTFFLAPKDFGGRTGEEMPSLLASGAVGSLPWSMLRRRFSVASSTLSCLMGTTRPPLMTNGRGFLGGDGDLGSGTGG